MDIGVFPTDFPVNHRFRCTCTGRNVFVFKDTVREMIAQGVIMRSAFLSPKELKKRDSNEVRAKAAHANGEMKRKG
jgi:hypothetical protein